LDTRGVGAESLHIVGSEERDYRGISEDERGIIQQLMRGAEPGDSGRGLAGTGIWWRWLWRHVWTV
jgi:hypothetical protein